MKNNNKYRAMAKYIHLTEEFPIQLNKIAEQFSF